MKFVTIAIVLGTLAATAAGAAVSHHPAGSKGQERASIGLTMARRIALQQRAGAIIDEQLATEPGGSGQRYIFDVKGRSATYEVGVDARTGRVLEYAAESPVQAAGQTSAGAAAR
jgi:uncharacterized membrane protein YkoI